MLIADDLSVSPVIGDTFATFQYTNPHATTVTFMSDSTEWHEIPMGRDGDLWSLTRDYPYGARDEYLFVVDGTTQLDPLNPHRGPGAFGTRSACMMPGYRRPAPFEFPVDGRMQRAWLGGRIVDVYVPAVVDQAAVLIVQDGYEYIWFTGMPGLLDVMIRAGAIMPTLAVFVAPRDRDNEYAGSDDYIHWMADRLVPAVQRRYPVATDASRHGLVGASAGGLVATYGAALRSDTFRLIGAQSPAYRPIHGIDLLGRLEKLGQIDWNAFRLYADAGTFEMMLHGREFVVPVRSAVAELGKRGCAVEYNESHEGHTWTSWAARLPDLLTWLVAAP